MSVPLSVSGTTYQYPQQYDTNWGPTLTNWSTAVTNLINPLYAGGSLPILTTLSFGSTAGLQLLTLTSQETTPATAGIIRLANASTGINWRNAANSANLALTVNASNQLTFNGTSIGATTSLTDNHILVGNASNQPADVAMSGDVGIVASGATTIQAGAIVDSKVSASAAITLSKLAPTTAYYWYAANASGVLTPLSVIASQAVITDSNGLPSTSSTTATELSYVHGVTSAIQTQIGTLLPLSGGTMSGTLNMGSNKIISIAGGTNSGEAITYNQSNSITTSALVSNAVSQVVNSSANSYTDKANTITTQAITTSGGVVLIMAQCGFITSGGTPNIEATMVVTRGGTGINGNRADFITAITSDVQTLNITTVDTPTAGTYTYNLTYSISTGSVTPYSYNLILVELKR